MTKYQRIKEEVSITHYDRKEITFLTTKEGRRELKEGEVMLTGDGTKTILSSNDFYSQYEEVKPCASPHRFTLEGCMDLDGFKADALNHNKILDNLPRFEDIEEYDEDCTYWILRLHQIDILRKEVRKCKVEHEGEIYAMLKELEEYEKYFSTHRKCDFLLLSIFTYNS